MCECCYKKSTTQSKCKHQKNKAVFLLFSFSDFSATSQFSQLWSSRHHLVTLILTNCFFLSTSPHFLLFHFGCVFASSCCS
ncbi:hypothetical protein RJT34_15003 [Clitoria ternatea]|uniref:Uncharacterized protein n=1 Tax=Clitoria ternatea TaxID=43366 RepID=A0AAN9JTE5_CLITE